VESRHDATLAELAIRWYVQMLDTGMRKCEQTGQPLTDEQRFILLTAGQLAVGNWYEPLRDE
jgi:hypothetical protein